MYSREFINKLLTFQKRLGYRFNNVELLIKSLTHRSFAHENSKKDTADNERLEFLGDSVLQVIVSEYLLKKFSHFSEGELTKVRAKLVNDSNLSKKALQLRLGNFLRLGKGEILTGGRRRNSILASGLEAVIGAIYLDGGLENTSLFIRCLFKNDIKPIISKKGERNWKELLQQYTQKKFKSHPDYEVIKEKGPPHRKKFVVAVKINNRILGNGTGDNKKQAEQQAAKASLYRHFRKYLNETRLQ